MFKLFVVLGSILACCYAVDSSKGEVWPKPQQQLTSEDYLVIQSHTFKFKGPADIGCPDFLNAAFTRYWTIIATSSSLAQRGQVSKAGRQPQKKFREVAVNPVGDLDSLNVALIGECANEAVLPDLGDDESCELGRK
jgi:hexosaminidase